MSQEPLTAENAERLARRLEAALETRVPIRPFSESESMKDVADAYAVQTAWTDLRLLAGDSVVGRKIGLTNDAMRHQMGVPEPDYGSLWGSGRFEVRSGHAAIPSTGLIHPMVEPEIALLIGDDLKGPEVTTEEVLRATEAVGIALEVLDSRFEDWRITIVDTVSDNASYAGFVLGPWSRDVDLASLDELRVQLSRDGALVGQGTGAAALGHPATATAWLVNKLGSFEISLHPGDIVLSGSLDRAVPAHTGDKFVLEASGFHPVIATFD